jgi:transposase-like protein
MNPQAQLCPNLECRARGSDGNIWVHSQKTRRYRCKCCGRTFTETAQTAFYGLKKAPELVVLVVTLLAYGCPVAAIVQAFRLDERTVWAWLRRAGTQCQRLQAGLVEQQRLELGQIQADELKIKVRDGVLWAGMVMQVATRLWLGGAVSAHRDQSLLRTVFGFAHRADGVVSCWWLWMG